MCTGHTNLVLGAFGCGAFANPPDLVGAAFVRVLGSEEFRGAFQIIAFAITESKGSDAGNIDAFQRALGGLCAAQPAPVAGGGGAAGGADAGGAQPMDLDSRYTAGAPGNPPQEVPYPGSAFP